MNTDNPNFCIVYIDGKQETRAVQHYELIPSRLDVGSMRQAVPVTYEGEMIFRTIDGKCIIVKGKV